MKSLINPCVLTREHDRTQFDSGEKSLDHWLKRNATQNQKKGMCKVYVTTENTSNKVVGYYALAPSSVDHKDAPDSLKKGVARHPIPTVLLARLAVDKNYQGTGTGEALLKDALLRMVSAAQEIGGRAILVHALNDNAVSFYKRYGFVNFEGDEEQNTMYILIDDAVASLEEAGHEISKTG